MKILFAEDEEHIAKLIEFILKKEGHEVTFARDGQEALNKLESEPFDLVILDVMMPKKTGWEVLKEIRDSSATASQKVVMLTAKSQESDIQEASKLGADGFLNKPFKPEELRDCMNKMFGVDRG